MKESKEETIFRYVIITLIVLGLTFAVASCSPIKRMQRIARKHPEIFLKDTTIKVYDTVKVTQLEYRDSIIFHPRITDTVFLKDPNTKTIVKIYRPNLNMDSLKAVFHTPPDTIYIPTEKEIKVPIVVVPEEKWYQIAERKIKELGWITIPIAIILLIIVILFFFFRKKLKNLF